MQPRIESTRTSFPCLRACIVSQDVWQHGHHPVGCDRASHARLAAQGSEAAPPTTHHWPQSRAPLATATRPSPAATATHNSYSPRATGTRHSPQARLACRHSLRRKMAPPLHNAPQLRGTYHSLDARAGAPTIAHLHPAPPTPRSIFSPLARLACRNSHRHTMAPSTTNTTLRFLTTKKPIQENRTGSTRVQELPP